MYLKITLELREASPDSEDSTIHVSFVCLFCARVIEIPEFIQYIKSCCMENSGISRMQLLLKRA